MNDDNDNVKPPEIRSNPNVVRVLGAGQFKTVSTVTNKPPAPGAKGLLARVFREVINITTNQLKVDFNRLLTKYVSDQNANASQGQRVQDRGNVIKEIRKDKMTWIKFCKHMRIFPFVRMEIVFRFYDSKERYIDVHVKQNLRDKDDLFDEDDEGETDA